MLNWPLYDGLVGHIVREPLVHSSIYPSFIEVDHPVFGQIGVKGHVLELKSGKTKSTLRGFQQQENFWWGQFFLVDQRLRRYVGVKGRILSTFLQEP